MADSKNHKCDESALRLAVEHLGQGIAVFNQDRLLDMSNDQFQTILDLPGSLCVGGTSLADVVRHLAERGDYGEGDVAELAQARLDEIERNSSGHLERSGPNGQYLEVRTHRLPNEGLVISYTDISARVAAERELAQVNQSLEKRVQERTKALTHLNTELERARAKADAANLDKTRFLAAASHDLLQPLNAARLYTSTMVERAHGTDLARLAANVDDALVAVEDIMSALLDISRVDSGALKPSISAFSIRELLKKVKVEFEPAATAKDINLRLVGADAMVSTDRRMVARVLQNLVSNAIKYTAKGGAVLVGCRKRGNRIRLDVIDNGIGIDKDQHSLIFTEFSRLEPGARIAQGLGLGLSIVQRFGQALNLDVELDSVPGRGSRFSIYLPPAADAPPPPPAKAATPPQHGGSMQGKQILCVDNEPDILEAMKALLDGWGCDVRVARSLKQISQLDLLEGWVPDIVLMDYHLDQSSGLDAIQWLRQTVGGHLPAILITADRSAQVQNLAEERNVSLLPKPLKPAALRALMSRLD
ncbi:ATP-binding response regulator [Maritalea mediterranea]|uniref:histidine kinase n=1 Tax=Maritalea mediterranea TaxID=2909667 RepID=A0ABS9E464_9HYPH|nr:PAS-domain containing protein [Maritalea mediterranea]MCF4097662.1 PAS-domain containing protein [Maritalea mediterranea]